MSASSDPTSRLRVLHVNTEKTWRGGERQTLLTAREQREQGIEARIACRSGAPLEHAAREAAIPVVKLGAAAPRALLGLIAAMGRFELIHCHTGKAHSLAAIAGMIRRKPLVISRRVDFVPRPTGFNRWKYRHAGKIVCVSRCIQKLLIDWGVAAEKTAVIYEAVPGNNFLTREAARKELSERTGVNLGPKIVGNIAALVDHKDHATLLRAARIIAERKRDVMFVIVGDGERREELMALRSDLGLTSRVLFTGFIPEAQRFLPALDVFVMSSRMEGLGTIVLDAGAAGVPVVATEAGGLPEAVLAERTGLLAPVANPAALAEASLRLLSDPALAGRLAAAAKARVCSEFSPKHMAEAYVRVYQEVLDRVKSAPGFDHGA